MEPDLVLVLPQALVHLVLLIFIKCRLHPAYPLLVVVGLDRYVRPWELESVIVRQFSIGHCQYRVLRTCLVHVKFHTCDQHRYLPHVRRSLWHWVTILVEPLEVYGQQQWCVLVVLVTVYGRGGTYLLHQCYAVGLVYFKFHLGEVTQVPFSTGTCCGQHVHVFKENVKSLCQYRPARPKIFFVGVFSRCSCCRKFGIVRFTVDILFYELSSGEIRFTDPRRPRYDVVWWTLEVSVCPQFCFVYATQREEIVVRCVLVEHVWT